MPGLLYAVTPLQALSAAAEREVSFTAFFPDVNVFSAAAAGASARAVFFPATHDFFCFAAYGLLPSSLIVGFPAGLASGLMGSGERPRPFPPSPRQQRRRGPA